MKIFYIFIILTYQRELHGDDTISVWSGTVVFQAHTIAFYDGKRDGRRGGEWGKGYQSVNYRKFESNVNPLNLYRLMRLHSTGHTQFCIMHVTETSLEFGTFPLIGVIFNGINSQELYPET
jgi:hypothetical protein